MCCSIWPISWEKSVQKAIFFALSWGTPHKCRFLWDFLMRNFRVRPNFSKNFRKFDKIPKIRPKKNVEFFENFFEKIWAFLENERKIKKCDRKVGRRNAVSVFPGRFGLKNPASAGATPGFQAKMALNDRPGLKPGPRPLASRVRHLLRYLLSHPPVGGMLSRARGCKLKPPSFVGLKGKKSHDLLVK